MRRRSHNEPKEGGNGFLGLGKKESKEGGKFSRRQRESPTVLDEVVVTADAPRWLNYRRQYEIDNPKDAFLEKNITGFDKSFGTTKRNYPKRLDKQYNKRANDYVAEQLIAEYETKYGDKPRRLRTAEERLGIYDYYNEQERDILKNSKHASWYLPAERQHRIRVSDNPDAYVTESYLKTDSEGNITFDEKSGRKSYAQKLSNKLEGTPERFRVFSNAGNDLESYINPAMWIGEMARNIGQAPYKAMQTGSALPIIGAIAEPLLSGIPLGTIGKEAKKAVGENRVDTAVDILKNLRKEVDPRFKEPREAALEWANKTQEKYYNSPGFHERVRKIRDVQQREFKNAITRNVLKRGADLDDLKEVMDMREIGDYIVHNLSPVDNWDLIQRNAENKKYLAFFESNKNRLKNFKENKPSALHYDEGYAKGRAAGISGWRLDSNLDPYVRHNLVDPRLDTDDINRVAFHEGNHGLTNGNGLLNKQTKDFLQSPFDLTDVHPRNGNDYVNRKSYILDPTEIYARIQEMRLHSSHGDFKGLDNWDKINLKNRSYGQLNNDLRSKVDPIFWDSVKDWDKLFDVMNKMPAIAGAGLGLKALQNQNPEQFKKGGVVGGDDPKNPTPDPFMVNALYKNQPVQPRSYEVTDSNTPSKKIKGGTNYYENNKKLESLIEEDFQKLGSRFLGYLDSGGKPEDVLEQISWNTQLPFLSVKAEYLRKMNPTAEGIRDLFANYSIRDSGDLANIQQVMIDNGNPTIKSKDESPLGINKAHALGKSIYVKRLNSVLGETAHTKQYQENGFLPSMARLTKDFFSSMVRSDDDVKAGLYTKYGLPNGSIPYGTPGTLENDAHDIIEPQLRLKTIENANDYVFKDLLKQHGKKLPKFKKGGFVDGGDDPKKPNQPTRQDSVDLLHNTQMLLSYFNNQKYSEKDAVYISRNTNRKGVEEFNRIIRQQAGGKRDFYKKIDDNKYYQRESAHTILDRRSPKALYDNRIEPTRAYSFVNEKRGDEYEGDAVAFFGYEPLLVKPVNTLSKEERVERAKREKELGLKPTFKYYDETNTTKKPTQPVELIQRDKVNIKDIQELDRQIDIPSRNVTVDSTNYNLPQSRYSEGVLKQAFKGVPNIQVWSKRDKETGTLRPVALINEAGESIDYNKYKEGKLPEGFQHPKKFEDGGYINNNMTDPNNYLWNMLMKMQRGVQSGQFLNDVQSRQGEPTAPLQPLPIKPLDPDVKPNWPPGNEVPPGQLYNPKSMVTPTLPRLDIKPLPIPERKMEEPNPSNFKYNLTNNQPKPKDPLLGGLLAGVGAVGGTMANVGRPDVGLGALSGVASGAGYGAMLGPVGAVVGGVLGGIGGLASTGLNRTRYDEQNAEAQKGKIKAATIYGGDVGSFEFGGNVYSADGEEIVPIQTEKGEKIVTPEGYIHTSKAMKLHKQMENDLVTDILPNGSYVASNSRAMQILRDKANKMIMGYDTVEYLEGGGSPIPKEHSLGEIMKKKKMTPAEILDIVKNKFPTNQIEYDQFAKKANVLNLKSRLPYINAVIAATKK